MKKYLLRFGIITILITLVIFFIPAFISTLKQSETVADIHKIKSDIAPYLYKYQASTFNLRAGKENGFPSFKITQMKRSLDFDVRVEPKPSLLSEQLEKNNPNNTISLVTVQASEEVRVINENTDPAIEYEKVNESSDFILNPDQEKIEISWELLSEHDLPALQFETEKLIPKQHGDSIIFYTRTFRKAFELKDTKLTVGNESKPVGIALTDSNNYFYISFNISSGVDYPAILSLNLVSLFHERLIDANPTESDFSAFEKPEFLLDTSEVDEPLKSALEEKDYTNVKFGIIDATGSGHRVPAELAESDGKLLLRFTRDSYVEPGLYDLLVQYKDEPSYIGNEEFSWGVLAINPDQSIYRPGQTAKIDMAVLDHLGRMVCDARVALEIIDPNGNITKLSTKNGEIKISPECHQKDTDLPDYTTNYQTSVEGKYKLKLTAVTENGEFSIKDSFFVDADSPFYVKRIGPTRIFPPKTYGMRLEIETQNAILEIIEKVPHSFTIVDSGDFTKDGSGNLVWRGALGASKTLSLSYQFKTPNISPALFLLGPLKIGDWNEHRSWQLAIDDTGTIDPDGDGTQTGVAEVTCGGGGVYDCLDDQVRDPTTPSTSGDYADYDKDDNGFYLVTTLSGVDTVTQVDVKVYHQDMSGSMHLDVSLFDSNETTQHGSTVSLANTTSAKWDTATFSGLSLTQTQLDNLRVRLYCVHGGGPPNDCEVYAMYADITYTSTGPTNDKLLRHGTWFDAGVEQSMTF